MSTCDSREPEVGGGAGSFPSEAEGARGGASHPVGGDRFPPCDLCEPEVGGGGAGLEDSEPLLPPDGRLRARSFGACAGG